MVYMYDFHNHSYSSLDIAIDRISEKSYKEIRLHFLNAIQQIDALICIHYIRRNVCLNTIKQK